MDQSILYVGAQILGSFYLFAIVVAKENTHRLLVYLRQILHLLLLIVNLFILHLGKTMLIQFTLLNQAVLDTYGSLLLAVIGYPGFSRLASIDSGCLTPLLIFKFELVWIILALLACSASMRVNVPCFLVVALAALSVHLAQVALSDILSFD